MYVDIYDFETVLIHELGHSFGLGHIENISLNYTVITTLYSKEFN